MKYLNVAEKNAAAKNIALQLSRNYISTREGLSKYNKIYEFQTELLGQQCHMVMTSVSGHLMTQKFDGNYNIWNKCKPLELFDAPISKFCDDDKKDIKNTLQREVKECQGLIIWTDCDREGENIGFEIIDVCTAVKNDLKIFRANFSAITSESLVRSLQNLEQPNENISKAVDVRIEMDLRIGAAFTRFQTVHLQKVFPTKVKEGAVVSFGSCLFPTLGFVVDTYKAVKKFVSEPYWIIKVNHTINNLSVDFTWKRIKLFDHGECQLLYNICLANPRAKVCEVRTEPKAKWRPLPLNTVELVKLASTYLNIKAKDTMELAQNLYTEGCLIYPRTETNQFDGALDLSKYVSYQTEDPEWGDFAQNILNTGGPTPRQGDKNDGAHPPIYPTKYRKDLSGDEKRLYELIVRSFLACCSKDAQGQETSVSINIATEKFTANGLNITAKNYLEVYPYEEWSSVKIHVYQDDQNFDPSIEMIEGNTSSPDLLTEADLITLMDDHGIGTDATHVQHIENLKERKYAKLPDDIHFEPDSLGIGLIDAYDAMGLESVSKPYLRNQLETDLKAICEGRRQPQQVLAEQIAKFKEMYKTVVENVDKLDAALAQRFNIDPASGGSNRNVLCQLCDCNEPAKLLTVRKRNENCGKKFYRCATGIANGGCDFFLWASESEYMENEETEQNPCDTPSTSSDSRGNSKKCRMAE